MSTCCLLCMWSIFNILSSNHFFSLSLHGYVHTITDAFDLESAFFLQFFQLEIIIFFELSFQRSVHSAAAFFFHHTSFCWRILFAVTPFLLISFFPLCIKFTYSFYRFNGFVLFIRKVFSFPRMSFVITQLLLSPQIEFYLFYENLFCT